MSKQKDHKQSRQHWRLLVSTVDNKDAVITEFEGDFLDAMTRCVSQMEAYETAPWDMLFLESIDGGLVWGAYMTEDFQWVEIDPGEVLKVRLERRKEDDVPNHSPHGWDAGDT